MSTDLVSTHDLDIISQRVAKSGLFPKFKTVKSVREMIGRFLAKAEVGDGGCWIWTAAKIDTGYGKFSIRSVTANGKRTPDFAHRVSHMLFIGPIPDGLVIDHLCRNRSCVNPAHLEAVTQLTNLIRSDNRVGRWSYTTHCNNGHERTEANIYVSPGKSEKHCRLCMQESDLRRTARRRASKGVSVVN